MLALSTTGSRTSTSLTAWPTPARDQAMAMTRTVPLNCGMSNETVALPSGPTATMPESPTILLVDDEDAIQKLLTYPLERDGYRVVQALE